MAWSLIAKTVVASNGATVTTPAINTTGADLIVVAHTWLASDTPTPNDSNGNTWLTAVGPITAGSQKVTLVYSRNPTVGAGHTFGTSGANAHGSCAVVAYSGSLTGADPKDQTSSATIASGNTTEQAGSITPAVNNELVVFSNGIDSPAGSTFSVDSGFTIQDQVDVNVGSTFGTVLSTLVQSIAAAVNPTLTRNTSGATDAALIASFKAAAGGIVLSPQSALVMM